MTRIQNEPCGGRVETQLLRTERIGLSYLKSNAPLEPYSIMQVSNPATATGTIVGRFYRKENNMDEKCFDCSHSKEPAHGNYCYMFKSAPEILPCGQHDKFKLERQITGQLITKHPEILAMMIASIGHI